MTDLRTLPPRRPLNTRDEVYGQIQSRYHPGAGGSGEQIEINPIWPMRNPTSATGQQATFPARRDRLQGGFQAMAVASQEETFAVCQRRAGSSAKQTGASSVSRVSNATFADIACDTRLRGGIEESRHLPAVSAIPGNRKSCARSLSTLLSSCHLHPTWEGGAVAKPPLGASTPDLVSLPVENSNNIASLLSLTSYQAKSLTGCR